jgi:hypothetical protein
VTSIAGAGGGVASVAGWKGVSLKCLIPNNHLCGTAVRINVQCIQNIKR